ncbi:MAG: OmpA family protein [Pseudomonadota bacterium]
MKRHLVFTVLLAAIAFVCYELGQRGARAYERMLVSRVTDGLDVLELTWAKLSADGLKLELRGHAPDPFARDLALESARATAPMASITDYSSVTLAAPPSRDPIRVELYRDARGITMTGQLSSREMRQRLSESIARDGPDVPAFDLTGIQAKSPPRTWGPEIEVASLAASRLPNAFVVMQPGEVTIEGQVSTVEERDALTSELLLRALDRVTLILRIGIPDEVIAPFAFSVYKDAGGGIRVERCAARDVTEQSAILGALTRVGAESPEQACPVGLGGPRGAWPDAVVAGLTALHHLPAGRFDIEYTHARLRGYAPTTPKAFDRVRTGFLESLPAAYQGAAALHSDDVATRTSIAREQYWMQLTRHDHKLTLSGQVHDLAAKVALETYALALFGVGRSNSALTVSGAPPPRGWQSAAAHAIGTLARYPSGEVRLAGYRITMDLTAAEPAEARVVQTEAEDAVSGFEIETRVTVGLPSVLAGIPLPGPRCTAALREIIERSPIDFDAGSAVISDSSNAVLNELADCLRRCVSTSVEIAGHTDARGSTELNARLSKARAEAVLEALAERGVSRDGLVARGFGESKPIADNQTDAGRARNRRIEFNATDAMSPAVAAHGDQSSPSESREN